MNAEMPDMSAYYKGEPVESDQVDSLGNPISDQVWQAYKMLQAAGERIGMNNYRSQLAAHLKAGRKKSTFRFTVTKEHQSVCDAMPLVLSGEMTPEDVYFLIHGYDVNKQRLGL